MGFRCDRESFSKVLKYAVLASVVTLIVLGTIFYVEKYAAAENRIEIFVFMSFLFALSTFFLMSYAVWYAIKNDIYKVKTKEEMDDRPDINMWAMSLSLIAAFLILQGLTVLNYKINEFAVIFSVLMFKYFVKEFLSSLFFKKIQKRTA